MQIKYFNLNGIELIFERNEMNFVKMAAQDEISLHGSIRSTRGKATIDSWVSTDF